MIFLQRDMLARILMSNRQKSAMDNFILAGKSNTLMIEAEERHFQLFKNDGTVSNEVVKSKVANASVGLYPLNLCSFLIPIIKMLSTR